MPKTRTPRSSWIDKALQALAEGGPEAVRIEALARELGVTKGGFYWHFRDRNALLTELLDNWEQRVVDDVIERVDAGGGDARARLARLFTMAAASRDLPRIEPAIRNWARHDAGVAERLRRIDDRRMVYMRTLFSEFVQDDDEVEARCYLVFAVFVGSRLVTVDHAGRTRAEVHALAMDLLLARDEG